MNESDGPAAEQKASLPVRSPTFAALALPAFRRYYMGQGISLIGTWLQAAAVKWIVFEQTGSEFLLGVVEVANLMPGLVVGLFAGVLADRVRPRSMILIMELAQMALALVLAGLVRSGHWQFWQLALVLALARVSVTFEHPSRQIFFYELVGPERLQNAIALNSGLFNATRVIGPALAGLGLAVLGAAGCFTVNAVSYLAAIAAVYSIPPLTRPRNPRTRAFGLRELLDGLSYIGRARHLRNHFLLMAFFGLVGMGYEAMIPAYAGRIVATDVGGYSVLMACTGVGATAAALALASLGGVRRKELLVVSGMCIFSLSLAAAAFFPYWVPPGSPAWLRVPAAGFCLLGAGFGAALFYASTQTLVQLEIPDHLRGRVMGVWLITFSGSVPLGALWTGRVASALGVTRVMALSALACALTAILFLTTGLLRSSRHKDDDQGPFTASQVLREPDSGHPQVHDPLPSSGDSRRR